MNLTFEDGDVFTLQVKEGNVAEGFTGYRYTNKIILNKETYWKWHCAVRDSDFSTMESIISSCLDFASYQLQTSNISNLQLSYNISEK